MVQPFFIYMDKKLKSVVNIQSLAFEGKGVARIEGKVVFVRFAVPGDVLEIELLRDKKNFSEGKIVSIIQPSPLRINPRCEHFGVCGGCSFQNIPYDVQLQWKRQFIVEAFEKIAKLNGVQIRTPIPSPKTFEYRNKMEFSFGSSRWITDEQIQSGLVLSEQEKHFALGFHIPERFDKVLNINNCLLQDSRGNKIINEIRNKALEWNLQAYNLRSHKGFLRNLIIRYSFTTNELLVNLITSSQKEPNEREFLDWFKNYYREQVFVNHLVHTVTDSFSPTSFGDYQLLKGDGYLFEEISGVKFRISPFSFFQVNTLQARSLVEKVKEFAQAEGKVVWDLYSGAGTFSLPLAMQAKYVVGLESVASSIEDAKFNAQLNGINNVDFIIKDLHHKKILQDLMLLEPPEIVIVDPPRTGLHKNLLNALMKILPQKIVYVSCNPTTMARDCGELAKFYELVEIQPIDMFPQTYHIESVGLLVKR